MIVCGFILGSYLANFLNFEQISMCTEGDLGHVQTDYQILQIEKLLLKNVQRCLWLNLKLYKLFE